MIIYYCFGGVAQLGERLNGIQEVNGSIPSVSTITAVNLGFQRFLLYLSENNCTLDFDDKNTKSGVRTPVRLHHNNKQRVHHQMCPLLFLKIVVRGGIEGERAKP